MPVVRGGDHHRVDVFSSQNLSKVFGHGAVFIVVLGVDHGFGFAHAISIHVANHHDFCGIEFEVFAEVPIDTVAANANKANSDFVAGGIHAENGGWNDERQGDGCCGGADEVPSRELSFLSASMHSSSELSPAIP